MAESQTGSAAATESTASTESTATTPSTDGSKSTPWSGATSPAGWTLAVFEPKEASREVWTAYHAFRHIAHDETRPDDPHYPDDATERDMRHDDPFSDDETVLAFKNGRVVGSFWCGWDKPGSPGYDSNRQFMWAGGHVIAPERRQGIATAWFRRVAELMQAHDHTVLGLWSAWPDGHAFIEWLGGEQKSTGAENRLDLREVDWAMVDRWVDEGHAKSPATKLELHEHRLPEAEWEAFCPAMAAMLNTMPFDDLEHGEIVMTPEMLADRYKRWDEAGESHHLVLTREPDGTISGITDVNFDPQQPDRLHQMFTGVRPDCRGRGIGKLIKARMLHYLRQTYPDARWMITGNANSNDPMLAINRQLGFKTHRTGTSYQMSREGLEAKLGGAG